MSVEELDTMLELVSDSADKDGDGYVSIWEIFGILWRLWRMKV